MTIEELAKLCFAARPVLWALAIIGILLAAMFFVPKILGNNFGNSSSPNSLDAA